MTKDKILGLHHVTAIAGNAKRNLDFYTRVLGLRFIKKTVNFDDPHTYHFYFGNYQGEPGTILTFFPWEGITKGRRGTGQATETAFSIPKDSMSFWLERLKKENVIYNPPAKRFNEEYLTLLDPDGLKLELVVSEREDLRSGIPHPEIPSDKAIKGFYNVTLTLENHEKTARLLTDIFGYEATSVNVNRYRFEAKSIDTASVIDLVSVPGEGRGHVAGGSVHHVAFRVKDDATEMRFREKLLASGYQVTPQIDRNYFHSLYFREPGGVLFEIATENPGFTVDEPLAELGQHLKLPTMYESRREEIIQHLPQLN